jgi:spore coat protein U-like protein
MNATKTASALAAVVLGLGLASAHAATDTANMPVQIVITNACNVSAVAPTTLDFGTHGLLNANFDSTSTITVTCTTGATYTVALNGGGGGNVNARRMINGANNVGYQLYKEVAHTNVWGDTTGALVAGTGNGTAQTLTVYGRVAAQTTPPAGTYADSVTVTVTY